METFTGPVLKNANSSQGRSYLAAEETPASCCDLSLRSELQFGSGEDPQHGMMVFHPHGGIKERERDGTQGAESHHHLLWQKETADRAPGDL